MIKLNRNTKKAKNWLNAEVKGYKLNDVYGKYSSHKERAFNYCIELCKEKDGWDLCIIGYNASYFTIRFFTDAGTAHI